MKMDDKSDKARLTRWYDLGAKGATTLTFGRKMPFGKYKGMYMYCLIIKHPMYLNWILDNTQFRLTETEEWWKRQIDTDIEKYRANRLILGLAPLMKLGGVDNMENPHWIVE